jgi:sulfur carrier protein
MINVSINNNKVRLYPQSSIDTALIELQIFASKGIALALNDTVIPKAKWSNTLLQEGDKIIIIKATQGG